MFFTRRYLFFVWFPLVGALSVFLAYGTTAVGANGAGCAAMAQSYWTEFRTAALAGDAAKISDLASNSLRVRAELDDGQSTPVPPQDAGHFVLQKLDDDTGVKEEIYTQRSLIIDTIQPDTVECSTSEGEFRVGNLLFHFRSGIWSLDVIYSND